MIVLGLALQSRYSYVARSDPANTALLDLPGSLACGFLARAAHPRQPAGLPDQRRPTADVAAHPYCDDGTLQMSAVRNPPGLTIAGEIDEDTYPSLVTKLGELDGLAEIHLNLAGLTYCDLAGLRAIVRLASASCGSEGRRLVLHDLPPQLRAVLRIVGWDSTPGLVIDHGKSALPSAQLT